MTRPRRAARSVALLLALALAIIAWAAGCTGQTANGGMRHEAPVTVRTPVEVLLSYDGGGPGENIVEPVYSQCDLHGHRVFASRHPERFVVIADPSCQGGAAR